MFAWWEVRIVQRRNPGQNVVVGNLPFVKQVSNWSTWQFWTLKMESKYQKHAEKKTCTSVKPRVQFLSHLFFRVFGMDSLCLFFQINVMGWIACISWGKDAKLATLWGCRLGCCDAVRENLAWVGYRAVIPGRFFHINNYFAPIWSMKSCKQLAGKSLRIYISTSTERWGYP